MFFARKPKEFDAPFMGVADEAALGDLFAQSGPTLLYLHDPWCPISGRAFQEMQALPGPIQTVDVSTQSDLSREIEERTGIRHESPQAILLVDGAPVWNASHHRISSGAVLAALQSAETPVADE